MYEEYVFDASVKAYERTLMWGNELQQKMNMIERTRDICARQKDARLKAVY